MQHFLCLISYEEINGVTFSWMNEKKMLNTYNVHTRRVVTSKKMIGFRILDNSENIHSKRIFIRFAMTTHLKKKKKKKGKVCVSMCVRAPQTADLVQRYTCMYDEAARHTSWQTDF